MTPADLRLYDVLDNAALAVDEAEHARPKLAREHLDAARNAASAYAASAPPEAVHALGLLLDAASPARYRPEPQAAILRNTLAGHATAALAAARGDRNATVQSNADAAFAAEPLPRLRPAFTVVRACICTLARSVSAGTEAQS